jgi:hypothetical protein
MSGKEIAVFATESAVIIIAVVLILLLHEDRAFRRHVANFLPQGNPAWRLAILTHGPATAEETRVATIILGDFVKGLNLGGAAPWKQGEVCLAIRRLGEAYVDPPPELIEKLSSELSPQARAKFTLVKASACTRHMVQGDGVPLGTMVVSVPGAGWFCGEDWELGDVDMLAPSAHCFRLAEEELEVTHVINGR